MDQHGPRRRARPLQVLDAPSGRHRAAPPAVHGRSPREPVRAAGRAGARVARGLAHARRHPGRGRRGRSRRERADLTLVERDARRRSTPSSRRPAGCWTTPPSSSLDGARGRGPRATLTSRCPGCSMAKTDAVLDVFPSVYGANDRHEAARAGRARARAFRSRRPTAHLFRIQRAHRLPVAPASRRHRAPGRRARPRRVPLRGPPRGRGARSRAAARDDARARAAHGQRFTSTASARPGP